jgi:hypothetical protein
MSSLSIFFLSSACNFVLASRKGIITFKNPFEVLRYRKQLNPAVPKEFSVVLQLDEPKYGREMEKRDLEEGLEERATGYLGNVKHECDE